jgi:hypothetical protein
LVKLGKITVENNHYSVTERDIIVTCHTVCVTAHSRRQ